MLREVRLINTMNEIQNILLNCGLNPMEIDELLGRFLNQEAFSYVEFILIAEIVEADLFQF